MRQDGGSWFQIEDGRGGPVWGSGAETDDGGAFNAGNGLRERPLRGSLAVAGGEGEELAGRFAESEARDLVDEVDAGPGREDCGHVEIVLGGLNGRGVGPGAADEGELGNGRVVGQALDAGEEAGGEVKVPLIEAKLVVEDEIVEADEREEEERGGGKPEGAEASGDGAEREHKERAPEEAGMSEDSGGGPEIAEDGDDAGAGGNADGEGEQEGGEEAAGRGRGGRVEEEEDGARGDRDEQKQFGGDGQDRLSGDEEGLPESEKDGDAGGEFGEVEGLGAALGGDR